MLHTDTPPSSMPSSQWTWSRFLLVCYPCNLHSISAEDTCILFILGARCISCYFFFPVSAAALTCQRNLPVNIKHVWLWTIHAIPYIQTEVQHTWPLVPQVSLIFKKKGGSLLVGPRTVQHPFIVRINPCESFLPQWWSWRSSACFGTIYLFIESTDVCMNFLTWKKKRVEKSFYLYWIYGRRESLWCIG